MDFPTCMFPRELLAAYPDAKFILTVRDPDKWYASTRNVRPSITGLLQPRTYSSQTIGKTAEFPFWHLSWLLRPQTRGIKHISNRIWSDFFGGRLHDKEHSIAAYRAHEALCRETIPADQLLVFDVKTDGWEKLCTFLGKPVLVSIVTKLVSIIILTKLKNEEFPHEHEGGNMGAMIDAYQKQLVKEFAGYVVGGAGLVGLTALAILRRKTIISLVRGLRTRF